MSTFYLILISLFSGAVISALLYYKNNHWKKPLVYLLFFLRMMAIALLVYLLFAPLFKNSTTEEIKPSVAIIIDNSVSNTPKDPLRKDKIKTLQKHFLSKDIPTNIYDFNQLQIADSIKYNHPISNLKNLVDDVVEKTALNNVSTYIFLSDGIENSGNSLDQLTINKPLITVGCGDTTTKKDLIAKHITYNRSVFKGNTFKLNLFLEANEFKNKNITILLKEKNKTIQQKTIAVNTQNDFIQVPFTHTESSIGIHTYELEIVKQNEEYTYKNNKVYATVNVYENKQKILIVASSPHPDIKAIANALDGKENIEYKIHLPYLETPSTDVDLIIFHHLPDNKSNLFNTLIKNNIPKLYLIGNNTNIQLFNQAQSIVKIIPKSNAKDLAFPSVNHSFTNFIFSNEEKEVIAQYPPLSVIFGDYKISTEAQSIFHQKIGSTETDKPMIMVANDHKTGVAYADGWWLWRNYEQLKFQNTLTFDTWINKLIQYLALQPNHKKFNIKPTQQIFALHSAISFESEIYDELLNRSFNNEVKLDILSNGKILKSYTYLNSEDGQSFTIPGPNKSGLYEYQAQCKLNNKMEYSRGSFTVSEESIEFQQTKADWNKLKLAAVQNNGFFIPENELEQLVSKIDVTSFKTLLRTSDEYSEIIERWWLFLIPILLLTTEWLIRKRHLHI